MKTFSLIALIAVLTNESQQINLNSQYGVEDMKGDGTDPLFAHQDNSKQIEQDECMDSLAEAEAEMKKEKADKEAAQMAEFERQMNSQAVNSTTNTTANVTK